VSTVQGRACACCACCPWIYMHPNRRPACIMASTSPSLSMRQHSGSLRKIVFDGSPLNLLVFHQPARDM
jgi:hypothetical protein